MSEAESMIGWLERRLDYITDLWALNHYVLAFQKMWLEEFGTLDNVPEELKERTLRMKDELTLKKKGTISP